MYVYQRSWHAEIIKQLLTFNVYLIEYVFVIHNNNINAISVGNITIVVSH